VKLLINCKINKQIKCLLDLKVFEPVWEIFHHYLNDLNINVTENDLKMLSITNTNHYFQFIMSFGSISYLKDVYEK
jgi:hypothetical protein